MIPFVTVVVCLWTISCVRSVPVEPQGQTDDGTSLSAVVGEPVMIHCGGESCCPYFYRCCDYGTKCCGRWYGKYPIEECPKKKKSS